MEEFYMVKLYIAGAPIGVVECDYEDALEEILDYPIAAEMKDENAFIGLEDDKHRIINFVRIEENNWGVIVGTTEQKEVSTDELKKIIQAFYNGQFPNWGKNFDRNDFPDGIDEILEW